MQGEGLYFRGFPIVLCVFFSISCANAMDIKEALRATYVACSGIGDSMHDLKKMAGINTAVTGVGTAAGVGATVTGLVKASKDKKADEAESALETLKQLEKEGKVKMSTAEQRTQFVSEFDNSRDLAQEIVDKQKELDKLTKQSKALGNWRTGLMAGSTATNIAGAIIAGGNKTDADLRSRIDGCLSAVKNLKSSIGQARIDGYDVGPAENIVRACGEYEYVDVSKIDNRAKGAMISSIVGATTGMAGTITSASANSSKVRDDNSESGKQKEKNLNTVSNVLAGTTTVASATATVFNATQISAIKKVAKVAEDCERELNK